MKTPEELALKTFTIDDIRSWKPCYDPSKHLSENWTGTAIDILKHKSIPSKDKLWVVCREELIDAKTLRLFAVWCARQVEHLMTDERSRQAIMIAEQYALGNAVKEQLDAAWAAAVAAARDAAWDAARDVAKAAASAAAKAAASAAAGDAASAAAKAAVGNVQVTQLLKMLEGV